LRQDVLRHIVALKMLSSHPEPARLRFLEQGPAWALRAAFPNSGSAYDARNYPGAQFVVLIDGNSVSLMQGLLDDLPGAELVLKTSHPAIARRAVELGGGRLERAFLSFTAGQSLPPAAAQVTDGAALDPELAAAFDHFGGDRNSLERCFQEGARWFALRRGRDVHSACVVYQNFDTVWEVARLFTQPEWRRQGLARCVVGAALRYLLIGQRQPRYQVDSANLASVELARSLGLAEFLRMEHVLMPARARAA
jgi:GNAT superfamily N-acetyltransferase